MHPVLTFGLLLRPRFCTLPESSDVDSGVEPEVAVGAGVAASLEVPVIGGLGHCINASDVIANESLEHSV